MSSPRSTTTCLIRLSVLSLVWMISTGHQLTFLTLALLPFLASTTTTHAFVVNGDSTCISSIKNTIRTSRALDDPVKRIDHHHRNRQNVMYLWNPKPVSLPQYSSSRSSSLAFKSAAPTPSFCNVITELSTSVNGGGDSSIAANSDNNSDSKWAKRLLILWVHGLSIAVVLSYYPNLLPASLGSIIRMAPIFDLLPLNVWNLIHAVSGMLMGGTIITTTFLEWIMVNDKDADGAGENGSGGGQGTSLPRAIKQLWSLESYIVLPAVTGSMMSGLAQSYLMYGGIGESPRYVKAALHTMLTFGIWWALMDKKSQRRLVKAMNGEGDGVDGSSDDTDMSSIWNKRKIANVVSCGLVVTLYAIMVLKPFF